ncbi:hypothetical protein SAMN05216311_105318 [Chitinophaga sp. CF418]|nr:hypothetical protein SAMN05216311_105318 [Chitinophaga sp. CF418]
MYRLSLALLVIMAFVCSIKQSASSNLPDSTQHVSFHCDPAYDSIFHGDSGYITKKQLFPFVLRNNILDTIGSNDNWTSIPDQHTMGKFYRQKDGYIACIVNVNAPFESLVLFETTADGHIENIQPYLHHNYCNCWDDSFGFGKIQDYFYVRICGTGTAFTSSELSIFKKLPSQLRQTPIIEFVWKGSITTPDSYRLMHISSLNIDGQKLHTTYLVEDGNENSKKNAKQIDHFEVNYTLKDGEWLPDDDHYFVKYW